MSNLTLFYVTSSKIQQENKQSFFKVTSASLPSLLRRVGSSDAGAPLKCSCFLPVPSFIAQVCFVVVSARHYPQQDVRVNYCSVKVAVTEAAISHALLPSQQEGVFTAEIETFDQPAPKHFWILCCCFLVTFTLDHTRARARAVTSARRRRADFCQTISSSQTGAKRVSFSPCHVFHTGLFVHPFIYASPACSSVPADAPPSLLLLRLFLPLVFPVY